MISLRTFPFLLGLCTAWSGLGTLQASAADEIVADFESEQWTPWEVEGSSFGTGPVQGESLSVSGYLGKRFANSFTGGDAATGSLTLPQLEIDRDYLSFLISGGNHPQQTGVELVVDGQVVRTATGDDSGVMRWQSWDVQEFRGRSATLRIFDRATGGWGHINVDHIVLGDHRRWNASDWRLEKYRRSAEYYREPFRQQFHFSPELNWINDPNGLVYHRGEYHMFYQHNPHGNSWGHMSWGHAVSRDLVHWEHLPIALHEEYGLMIFSGSAVVDHDNTSGFGTKDSPPLVAVYTGHGHGLQTQDIAYSVDDGRSWTKHHGNPVIDLGLKDFRDPKVFWHDPSAAWIMVVALAVDKKVSFYRSSDLKEWVHLSDFGPAGVAGKPNWECPDMFELPVEGEPNETRWVLEVDMGGGAIGGGSGGEYFIGNFDGTRFIPESADSQWVDYGADFYAPVSWNDLPESDGRRIWIGWMNNWETADIPTSVWRGCMSVPRQLGLRRVDGELRLVQQPVQELEALRGEHLRMTDQTIDGEMDVSLGEGQGRLLELIAEFEVDQAERFGLRVRCSPEDGSSEHSVAEQQTVIGYDTERQQLYVDRTRSGEDGFHASFPAVHVAPLMPHQNRVRMHILVDASSVEVFGDHGAVVITDRIFPEASSDRVELFADGGSVTLVSLDAWPLDSVWHQDNDAGAGSFDSDHRPTPNPLE